MTENSPIMEKVIEGLNRGYHCSQIMAWMTLEMRGLSDPLLLRALGGLRKGMFRDRCCGTLTGCVCALSSYVPRPEGEPEPMDGYRPLVEEFTDWFIKTNGTTECGEILRRDQYCPGLMERSFTKMLEILESHGIDATV
jgi:hypothetical protein